MFSELHVSYLQNSCITSRNEIHAPYMPHTKELQDNRVECDRGSNLFELVEKVVKLLIARENQH